MLSENFKMIRDLFEKNESKSIEIFQKDFSYLQQIYTGLFIRQLSTMNITVLYVCYLFTEKEKSRASANQMRPFQCYTGLNYQHPMQYKPKPV